MELPPNKAGYTGSIRAEKCAAGLAGACALGHQQGDAGGSEPAGRTHVVVASNLQTPTELAKMFPLNQLSVDLAAGEVKDFSYIVPDECHDMHGAPPWCVDSTTRVRLSRVG